MVHFRNLLSVEQSLLAKVARAALSGFARTLETAQQFAEPADPGRTECTRLLEELQALLELTPGAGPEATETATSMNEPPESRLGLPAEFAQAPPIISASPAGVA